MRPRHLKWGSSQASQATAVMLLLACTSCSGTGEGLSAVTGKVVCDGQPAAGAVLYFHRQPGGATLPPHIANVVPSAIVQADGTFAVQTGALGYGAAPGAYVVLAQWPESADPVPQNSAKTASTSIKGKKVTVSKRSAVDLVPIDRLKGRYMDKSKLLLPPMEVKKQATDLGTIEIKLRN
jgi:hypothetical protein